MFHKGEATCIPHPLFFPLQLSTSFSLRLLSAEYSSPCKFKSKIGCEKTMNSITKTAPTIYQQHMH